MATIAGILPLQSGAPSISTPIDFLLSTAPVNAVGAIVTGRRIRTVTDAVTGAYSQVLTPGFYWTLIPATPPFFINVPTGSGTFPIDDLAVGVVPDSAPPTIVNGPTDRTVIEGSATIFTVIAKGAVPLSYQWFKDAVPIPGATGDSFTIASTSVDDIGSYWVVVTNANGTATSGQANLDVVKSGAHVPVVFPDVATAEAEIIDPYLWVQIRRDLNGDPAEFWRNDSLNLSFRIRGVDYILDAAGHIFERIGPS